MRTLCSWSTHPCQSMACDSSVRTLLLHPVRRAKSSGVLLTRYQSVFSWNQFLPWQTAHRSRDAKNLMEFDCPWRHCQIVISHYSIFTMFSMFSSNTAIVEILKLFPLVPSSVAAKASARYSSSRCTQCVPCGGASQRAAQWSAVHCVLSRQLTSAAASSSRFRRSSLSEDLFTSCSWVEKPNHCWWYRWWGLTSLMEKRVGWELGEHTWAYRLKAWWIFDLSSSFGFYLGSWIKFPQGQCLAFFAAMWSGAPPYSGDTSLSTCRSWAPAPQQHSKQVDLTEDLNILHNR